MKTMVNLWFMVMHCHCDEIVKLDTVNSIRKILLASCGYNIEIMIISSFTYCPHLLPM